MRFYLNREDNCKIVMINHFAFEEYFTAYSGFKTIPSIGANFFHVTHMFALVYKNLRGSKVRMTPKLWTK